MGAKNTQHQTRRGATLVLVAILVVALGCMAALGVDFARAYAGANELQTGADASALAGAKQLQNNPAFTGAQLTQAGVMAGSNNAFGTGITLASGDVEVGFFDPATGVFNASAGVTNAVRTGAQRQTALRLGGLFSISSLTPRRRGTAWIGNQSTRDCIKPWGINLSYINTLLGGGLTIGSQAGVNQLETLVSTLAGQQQMTVVVGPNINNPFGTPNVAPNTYSALTGANSSRKEYQNAIIGQNCDGTADYEVGTGEGIIGQQPGQGNGDIPRTTANSIELALPGNQVPNGAIATCAPQTGGNGNGNGGGNGPVSAACFAPGNTQTAGVDITVAAVSPNGVNTVTLNTLLGFRLMCVFRGGQQPGSGNPNETCPWLAAMGRPATNYVMGTLVGYPIVTTAIGGAGNGLGNTIGTAQKIILVQ